MTPHLEKHFAPASLNHLSNIVPDRPVLPPVKQNRYRKLETQATKTREAFERLDRSEMKLKTNATQILLAILRYAAAQDDPAD